MGKRLIIIGAAIFAALFLFSGIMLFSEYQDQKQSAVVFKQVTELVEKDFTESEQKNHHLRNMPQFMKKITT